jgi:hypothetical protein
MTNAKTITSDSEIAARPKYFEPYGAEIASGNRAWVLAALMSIVALLFARHVVLRSHATAHGHSDRASRRSRRVG